jgi:DNA/RNA-binding domain of Phe-tRNA-synthetase-like protein
VQRIGSGTAQDLPEVQRWREAYKEFGVKPRDARSSIESLLRRVGAGLPRINRLTDTYNAISVRHLVPVGGEDLRGYQGSARLVIADGTERFETVIDGEELLVTPAPGEIVWRDDAGVTCRRWNWRQCTRTRLTEQTTEALFIIDSLGPDSTDKARIAGADLVRALLADSPDAVFSSRLLGAGEEA